MANIAKYTPLYDDGEGKDFAAPTKESESSESMPLKSSDPAAPQTLEEYKVCEPQVTSLTHD